MSYSGMGNMYTDNFETVDEVAEYTDMQGAASVRNQASAPAAWRSSPTKMLIVLWVVCVFLYWLLGTMFRRYNV